MNLSTLALRISDATRRFSRFHKAVRRIYCVFRPGIRFQIERVFKNCGDVMVLKIGANDGVESDPLADFLLNDDRYRGVLVEPIPLYAAMLKDNYGKCGRFRIEQVAIAATVGTTKIYYVDENASEILGCDIPNWLRGVASLDRNHVLKHLAPEMHRAVKEIAVECLTVNDLLRRNHIGKIDLLQIDAEGFDWIILQQFNFNVLRPQIVLFEYKHLNLLDQEAAQSMMQQAGYQVRPMDTDILCLLK